jgi:hypothetical protein
MTKPEGGGADHLMHAADRAATKWAPGGACIGLHICLMDINDLTGKRGRAFAAAR